MKKYIRPIIAISTSAFLISCSGGSGSGSDANNDSALSAETDSTQIVNSADTANDLKVADYSDLRSTYELSLDVDILESKRSYLSLCNGEGVSDPMDVDYEDCLLRSDLQQGHLNQTIKVANHLNNLVAAIWFYDGSEPMLFRFNASYEENQSFEIKL